MKNIFFFFLICNYLSAQTSQIQLNENWTFRSMDNPKEFLAAKVPGTVHTDLFENELIPHPFVGNNELELQWISDERWQYVLEFELTKKQLKNQNIDLVFEGLDTYSKVYLNDELILESNNAFRTWKTDVKKLLKKKNKLRIEFTPTKIIEEQKKKEIPYELPEGNRIFTRKAQFQYGWDWGPKYNTMGIWRPVYLEFWNDGKLNDVYMNQLYVNKNMARMHFEINLKSKRKQKLVLDYFVNDEKINSIQIDVKNEAYNITTPFNIDQPKLWWTHNLGDPYLYAFKVQLKDLKGNLLDEKIVKKGIRTIELVTKKDEFGESFYFKLNGEPVFMKGANYIPQSSFQSWVSDENYEKLLSDVVDSNMNMLRVWGGGIYEDDYFYELCDEKGILIWQDFMFACAMYPGDEAFLENVKQEAIENVKRLRNHSSIALWCGNNESSEGWHRWGWQDGRSEVEKEEIWGNYQKLFNEILPEIVKEYTDLSYWETSPKFGRGDARYLSEGDAHDWWIWHDGHPFQDLVEKRPRFMSEFGFQAFPSLEVIKFINGGRSTAISSEEFKNHQKHSRGFDIIKTYMERDFPVPTNEEDYIYMSQLVQAYGIGNAIEAHRSSLNFPRTMGSLYWQLNDVWPAVSWSGIDAFGNWKALQYRVKEAFEPLQFFFREEENNKLGIYIVNDLKDDIYDEIKLEISDFEGNMLYSGNYSFSSLGNRDLITRIELDGLIDHKNEYFVKGTFRNLQNVYIPGKPKDWKLKDEPIEVFISEKNENGFSILLKSKTFQKSVWLSSEVHGKFADNFFDLLPNEPYIIEFKTDVNEFKLEDLEIKSLNDFVN